jgi:type III secretion protein Q
MKPALMPPSRLDLPAVARSMLAKINGHTLRREPWRGDIGDIPMTIQPATVEACREAIDRWTQLTIMVDHAPSLIYIPLAVLDRQIRAIDANLDISTLDPEICGMLMEMVFEPLVNVLEHEYGIIIQCTNVAFSEDEPPEDALGFQIDFGPLSGVPVIIAASPALNMRIKKWLDDLPVLHSDINELSMPVGFRAGYAVLTLDDLINIRPGDGIVMDANSVLQKSVIAVTGEAFAQTCLVTANGLELTGPLLNPVSGNLKGWTFMSDQDASYPGEGKVEPGAIGQINVRLVFEVGRLDLTVEELQTIDSGHVFDLGRPIGQSVDIIAGGRQIGAGELVRVGEQIGVRVDWILK